MRAACSPFSIPSCIALLRLTTLTAALPFCIKSMNQIFNDLLFESPEAQREFLEAEQQMDPTEAEKLRSVLGKPSQFVGRVMSLQAAKEHWRQWAVWEATEGAQLDRVRRELAAEGKALRNPAQRANIEQARKEWHDAVEWARQNEREWAEYKKAAIREIEERCKQALDARKQIVEQKRIAFKIASGKVS